MEKIGNNSIQLDFPPYMKMYYVVNVENLRLYEPPMIIDQEDNFQISSIEYFSLEYLDQL